MTGPKGGAPRTIVPGAPVGLPLHVKHGGSTAYHAPYRCRCQSCLDWRRRYDRELAARHRGPEPVRRRTTGRSPWYVCVDEYSLTYSWHDYDAVGRCWRCDAREETEIYWEQKWREQT